MAAEDESGRALTDASVTLLQGITASFTAIAAIAETESRRSAARHLHQTLQQAAQGVEESFITPPDALKISGVIWPAGMRFN